ncbi:hypothetical protein AAEY33_09090 [Peribacillus simplex]
MKGQTIITYPQCGGNKVKGVVSAFKSMMAIGVLCCVTIIGFPVGIVLIITALIMKYSKAKLKFRCQECKHDFKVQESTYTEYV